MRIYNAKKFENDYKSDRNTLKFRTCVISAKNYKSLNLIAS